jgi:hypothetical protein
MQTSPKKNRDSLWIEKQDTNVIEVKETVITKVTLDSLDSAGTAYAQLPIYVDSLVFDTAGMIQTFLVSWTQLKRPRP